MTVTVDGHVRYRWRVSTGATQYSTPTGSYTPFRMERMHYSREWDNAGMPHAIFFTRRGHSIHGSDHPGLGTPASHGCVRLTLPHAATLYQLVRSVGMAKTKVVVSGRDPPGYRRPTMPPRQPVGPFLEVSRRLEARAGEDVPFNIAIGSVDMLPARSIIAIRAIPPGATFSQGRPYGPSEWSLTPEESGDLRIHLPKGTTAGTNMRIELVGADGTTLASATTRLDIAQDPRAALILRSDESDRIDDLIITFQRMNGSTQPAGSLKPSSNLAAI
jgi:hypothetical protein